MNLEDQTPVTIYWVRGGKKIDTRTRVMQNMKAVFNERFAMKTILDYDIFNDDF